MNADRLARVHLRQIAESIGWRSQCVYGSYFRCEFCMAKHADCDEIPHAADCPVPPFREWVNSLEQEGVE